MSKPSILVIEDDPLVREPTTQQFMNAGYQTDAAAEGKTGLQKLQEGAWDVVVSDIRMPEIDGVELTRRIKRQWPDKIVILITAHGSVSDAVEAMKAGASDYLLKPFSFDELELKIRRHWQNARNSGKLRRYERLFDDTEGHLCGMVGVSESQKELFRKIRHLGPQSVSVLITGETGTGKEMVARALHENFGRGEFIPFSPAAVPEGLMESELFGHVEGAFTGASHDRVGKFEQANDGTLFLDDIDDMPLAMQPKLLRALQEGEVVRVGDSTARRPNVRIIAATKADLTEMIEARTFRSDLYFRLCTIEMHLEPLRNRPEDIRPLVHHFSELLQGEEGKDCTWFDEESLELFEQYRWPGNIRELRAVVEGSLSQATERPVTIRHLPGRMLLGEFRSVVGLNSRWPVNLKQVLEDKEKTLIRSALHRADGVHKDAARLLGIPRTTLQSKLEKYSIDNG